MARYAFPAFASLPAGLPHMVDMPVIVRHQDRGALRLDHRHDQALCRRRAVIWSLITGTMPPRERLVFLRTHGPKKSPPWARVARWLRAADARGGRRGWLPAG